MSILRPWEEKDRERPSLQLTSRCTLPIGALYGGVVALGDSGKSKTALLRILAESFLRDGLGFFFMPDSAKDIQNLIEWAYAAGRIDDVVLLGPADRQKRTFRVLKSDNTTATIPLWTSQMNVLRPEIAAIHRNEGTARENIESLAKTIAGVVERESGFTSGSREVVEKLLSETFLHVYCLTLDLDTQEIQNHLLGLAKEKLLGYRETEIVVKALCVEPLRSMIFGDTTVCPLDIRAGKIFICEPNASRDGTAGILAGVLIKRMFQRRVQSTQAGTEVVIWGGKRFFFPEDDLFQATAPWWRCITVLSVATVAELRDALSREVPNFRGYFLIHSKDRETQARFADLKIDTLLSGGGANGFRAEGVYFHPDKHGNKANDYVRQFRFHEESGITIEHPLTRFKNAVFAFFFPPK